MIDFTFNNFDHFRSSCLSLIDPLPHPIPLQSANEYIIGDHRLAALAAQQQTITGSKHEYENNKIE